MQFAFDIDLAAFAAILARNFSDLAEQADPVPLGFFDLLVRLLVRPAFAGGQAQVGYRIAVGQVANFRVLPASANQDDFVYAAHFRDS